MKSKGDLHKMYGENLNSKNQKEAKYVIDQQQLINLFFYRSHFFALYFGTYYLIGLRVSRSITFKFTAISSSGAICGSISSTLMTLSMNGFISEILCSINLFTIMAILSSCSFIITLGSWTVGLICYSFALLFWLSKL